jgi:hypothetical protein
MSTAWNRRISPGQSDGLRLRPAPANKGHHQAPERIGESYLNPVSVRRVSNSSVFIQCALKAVLMECSSEIRGIAGG